MSTIAIESIKHKDSTANNILLDSDGNVEFGSNVTVNGVITMSNTYVSNTYFQDNSSSVHALKLEGISGVTTTFSAGQQILISTYYRETGIGFNEGSISWNGSTGEVTVPEAGLYLVSHSMYNQGSNSLRLYININGTPHSLHHVTSSDEDGTRTFTDIFNLSANDVITITNVYASGQAYMGSLHTWFNIAKIG